MIHTVPTLPLKPILQHFLGSDNAYMYADVDTLTNSSPPTSNTATGKDTTYSVHNPQP